MDKLERSYYENVPENLVEGTDEELFKEYLFHLKLTPEDLGKQILDVGSGSSQFEKYAREHNISKNITSIDPRRGTEGNTADVQGRVEELPFQDESFDMVVSHSSIPNILLGDKDEIRQSFLEMLRVTRKKGEIRMSPVFAGEKDEFLKKFRGAIDEVLHEIEQHGGAHVRITPVGESYVHYDQQGNPLGEKDRIDLVIIQKE